MNRHARHPSPAQQLAEHLDTRMADVQSAIDQSRCWLRVEALHVALAASQKSTETPEQILDRARIFEAYLCGEKS